jgi:hypothetical protein
VTWGLARNVKGRLCASHCKQREVEMANARLSLFRRQSNARANPTVYGTVLRSQTGGEERPIEPMGDAEGAESNLGLDDIPQGLGSGMDLCWLHVVDRIGGRTSMNGGAGGARALKAFGKACNGNKRICYKALMACSSSGHWTRGTGQGEATRRV